MEVSNETRMITTMTELEKTKEELRRAKDEAMQSWLDSRPLIDELEKVQSSLAATKNRISTSTISISELEKEIETITSSIRSKKEEEHNLKATINGLNQDLDQTREEIGQKEVEIGEDRRARSEVKQLLRLNKQSLRALNLKLRAIRLETEAVGSSYAEAKHCITLSETDNTTIRMSQEEYSEMKRRAKEETSLGVWRVSAANEQRLAAEASRDLALRRLKELEADGDRSRKGKVIDKIEDNVPGFDEEEEKDDLRPRVGARGKGKRTNSLKNQERLMTTTQSSRGNLRQQVNRSSSQKKNLVEKKKGNKPSFLIRISKFLVRKLTRFFG